MKFAIGILFIVVGIFAALYISIWWGMVEPFMNVARMMDNHTLTAMLLAGELIKFMVRDFIAAIVGVVMFAIGFTMIKD